MRSILRRVAATAIVIALVAICQVTQAPPSTATACKAYTVIGVRGTGDGTKSSYGTQLPKAVDRFVAIKGSSKVAMTYVSYPATAYPSPSNPGNPGYTQSMATGRSALKTKISSYLKSCPSTKLVLLGYSQGAHIVGDVLQQSWLKNSLGHIHAVGLIGDPLYNPGLSHAITGDKGHGGMFGRRDSWPKGVFVYDVCNRGDQVCASQTQAQSLGYLTGWFGAPYEHQGYPTATYSPFKSRSHSTSYYLGEHVANRS